MRRIAAALKPGGRFLLEMIARDAVMRRYAARGWRALDSGAVLLEERHFEFTDGRQHTRWTYIQGAERREIEIVHHIPAPDHLALLFRLPGFAEVRIVEAPTGQALQLDSWRLAVIGKLG